MWWRGPGRRDYLPRPPVDTFELRTERLRLRPFVDDDLDVLAPILGDAEMMQHYPHPLSRDESRAWIEKQRRRYAEDGFGLWAMELLSTGEFVGDCGVTVQHVDRVDETEVGWHVKRELWGQGLATEAARAVIAFAREDLALERLISLIRPENLQSRRVAEKLGMTIEKETLHANLRHFVYVLSPSSSHFHGQEAATGCRLEEVR